MEYSVLDVWKLGPSGRREASDGLTDKENVVSGLRQRHDKSPWPALWGARSKLP